jgi:hypothetical protein
MSGGQGGGDDAGELRGDAGAEAVRCAGGVQAMTHVDDLKRALSRGIAPDDVKGPPRRPLIVQAPTLLQMVHGSLPKPTCVEPGCPICKAQADAEAPHP